MLPKADTEKSEKMETPAYFAPNYFEPGQSVVYGEFNATVVRHYTEGMWEIRLPGGVACVSGADLKRTGFFVDWDGNTRRVEAPGSGYTCLIVEKDGYLGVDVLDPDGFVCHEATYYPTLEALEAVGVAINLI